MGKIIIKFTEISFFKNILKTKNFGFGRISVDKYSDKKKSDNLSRRNFWELMYTRIPENFYVIICTGSMSIVRMKIVFLAKHYGCLTASLELDYLTADISRTRRFQRIKFCQVYIRSIYMFYW